MNNFKSIFLSLLLTFALGAHKYYVSTTLIDKDQNNYYKVTVKAFYDDIELELGLDERVVNYDDEYSNLRDLFKTYFMDNFILIADKKKIKYNFVGFEKRNDLLQFYIEFSLDDKTKEPSPYILVRSNLDAKISRSVFYDLVNIGYDYENYFGIWSGGHFFPFTKSSELKF